MAHSTPDRSLIHFGRDAAQVLQLFAEACLAPADRLTGWSLDDRNPAKISQMLPFFEWVYRDYFRVQTDGWEHIPAAGKMLLVGSHNGGLAAPDTVMFTYDWMRRFGPERPAYALMEPIMWQVFPGVARMAAWVGCVQADSHMAIQALRREAALLIYPGGVRDVFRPHHLRDKVCFFGDKRFIKLALIEEAPIIPVISYGAHDTLYVIADLYPQLADLHRRGMPWPWGINPGTFPVYLGLPWGLSIGPLPNIPLPQPLHTRVCAPIVFERYGTQASHDDDYIDACYEQVRSSMQHDLDQLFAAHA